MASKIFHILSKTTALSIHDILQGVTSNVITAWEKTEGQYDRLDKSTILEMVDVLCEVLSGISSDAPKEEELQCIVDNVCFAMLPSIEGAVFGSQSQHLGLDSQLYQSVCQLLSLCIVIKTARHDPDCVSARLQSECINAFSAYKEETYLISGGTGAQITFDKHLSIHTAMTIINNVFDRQANLGSLNSEWIQTCFDSVLSIIETSQTNVCTRLTGVILPKILQTEPNLQNMRCNQVWKIICAIHKHNAKEINTNVFIALCGLVNYFLPYGSTQQDTQDFSIGSRIEFWIMVQSGLVHTDPLARKQSLFLLKRAVDLFSSLGCDVEVKGEDDLNFLFSWKMKKSKQLLGVWADFFLLYETLQEVQVHVVKPVMPRLSKLIKAATTNQGDAPLLHSSWLTVIFQRSFVHETKTVVEWGVSEFLQLDLTKCPIMNQGGVQFVLDSVLEVLHEEGLFVRQPGTPIGICPSIVTDFKMFLQGCVKVLPAPIVKAFLHDLLERVCNKTCGPVALAFTMEALSELPRIPAWDQQSIKSIREFLGTGLIAFDTAYRSIIQQFLLTSTLNLLDTSAISMQHFSSFLSALSNKECLERGKTTWNQVCEWILVNKDANLFHSEGTSLQTLLSEDIVELLQEASSTENLDLPSLDEAERVARAVLIVVDAHQVAIEKGNQLFTLPPDHATSVLASILQPISDVLCRVSSHVYLSQSKADRALQLLQVLLKELQPESSLFASKEDTTKKHLEELMLHCTGEVLIYITRKLLSHHILQTRDMTRLHFYLSTLDSIYTFWYPRLSDRTSRSYQQVSASLRNTKEELSKATLNMLNDDKIQMTSIEMQGKIVICSKILLWLCTLSSSSSGTTSSLFSPKSMKLSSLLSIQAIPIKTLPPPQNGTVVSSQDWGRIQSQLLQCKWSCICLVLETRLNDVNESEDIDLLNILEMSVMDLQLVSGSDALPMIQCATMVTQQVVSSNSEICVDVIEASWCIVQDKWRSLDFWPVYKAFVKLTFQNCFLQPGTESNLTETINKYKEKIFELGNGRHGMVNILMSHICTTWADMLVSSEGGALQVVTGVTEHRELLLDACLFGSICNKGARMMTEVAAYFLTLDQLAVIKDHLLARGNKDSGVVRATVVNFLLKLGTSHREDLITYLCNFVIALLQKDQENAPVKKPYIINSMIHRKKQRAWQTALMLMSYIHEDVSERLYDMVMTYLVAENQTSVRYLMEWVLIKLLHKFPVLHSKLWEDLHVLFDTNKGNICPLLIVASHLAAIQPTTELKEAFYMKAIPIVMPWSLAQPQSLRTHGQLALYKLWKDCSDQGLTKVLTAFPAVTACMQFTQNHSTLMRLKEKIDQYFFAIHFHPVEDYSIETIFYTLPAMSYVVEEELLPPSVFEHESKRFWCESDIPLMLYNARTTLEQHRLAQVQYNTKASSNTMELELLEKDVQKKITPSKDIPGLEGLVEKEQTSDKGSLILVASLIDKPTNLGGLCRTSEIFGVSKLVLGSYRYVEDKQFTNLSVTAEKWLPVEEVKPNDLRKYLETMRHDGYTLVGVEQTANSKNLTEYCFPERTLLLLGNERAGIPVDLIQLLDTCVEIPQLGIVRSLNVHVSGALLIWEYTRQRLLNTTR
ncbi:probable methyltransferase TARBP1 [Amphiura filiformis]|uniref:probable methyltransferase TARBP1 n=1 Tax=Amphiura filiformis TaxID=82378 RepID=UPI003B2136D5